MTVDLSELVALSASFDRETAAIVARVGLVLDKTVHDVVATAQDLVPVDTGATKSSIHATTVGPFEREAGPTTEYSPYLEAGTSRMSPYPFMFPALDRHTAPFISAMRQAGDLRL